MWTPLAVIVTVFVTRVTCLTDQGHVSPVQCVGGAVGGHSPLPFCTPVFYSKLSPPAGNWVPTVYIDPIVSDDLMLDMLQSELSLSLKLSVYWQDVRIITRPDLNLTEWHHVSFTAAHELWTPVISISNLVSLARLDLHPGAIGGGELRVRGDRTINICYRLRITVACRLQFQRYPHDIQACQLIFKSSPTTPATPLTLFSPNVEVTSLREAGMETLVISPINMSLVTNLTADKNESFGLTGLTFVMSRNILPHIFLQYFPAALTTFVASLSLTIPVSPHFAQLRFLLIIITALILTFIIRDVRAGLPIYRVSTFIEQYLITNLFLVISLLIHTFHQILRLRLFTPSLSPRVVSHQPFMDHSRYAWTRELESRYSRKSDLYAAVVFFMFYFSIHLCTYLFVAQFKQSDTRDI